MFVTRPDSKQQDDVRQVSKAIADFASAFPALHEYLTFTTYPDGGERQTSTLLFFLEEGLWKLCLCDRASDRTLWASGDAIEDCLLTVEGQLQEGRAAWRQSRQAKHGRRKSS